MARRERVMRMSVEQPLWRALAGYRVLTMLYAIGFFATAYSGFARPWLAVAYYAVLFVWTLATLPKLANAASCTKRFLTADLTIALAGILLTPFADAHQRVADGGPTLPSIWTAGSVLAFAVKGGWRWAAVASTLVAVANLVERGTPARDTVHNVILVWVASIAIGYVVEVARASERTLARALEIEAATRERERLARDIHDSVLQVLAMVQRRGAVIGGEAAELGRLAGEQEVALRTLVSGGLVPVSRVSEDAADGALVRVVEEREGTDPDGPVDLRALLAPYAGSLVNLADPGAPVLLAPGAARELAAAVGAALDNVREHVGERGPRLDPGRGRTGRGDRHRPRRGAGHPAGAARRGRGRGTARRGPVDPRAAARPRRHGRADFGARTGHGGRTEGTEEERRYHRAGEGSGP